VLLYCTAAKSQPHLHTHTHMPAPNLWGFRQQTKKMLVRVLQHQVTTALGHSAPGCMPQTQPSPKLHLASSQDVAAAHTAKSLAALGRNGCSTTPPSPWPHLVATQHSTPGPSGSSFIWPTSWCTVRSTSGCTLRSTKGKPVLAGCKSLFCLIVELCGERVCLVGVVERGGRRKL